MKIGIVSSYEWLKRWDNYGTLLQNYALQSYLQRQGHQTFWIRTKSSRPGAIQTLNNCASKLCFSPAELVFDVARIITSRCFGKSQRAKQIEFYRRHPRQFNDFFERHIPHTTREYTIEDLMRCPPAADAYIVGSDNIWASVNQARFLGFCPAGCTTIAYAVSAPWTTLSTHWMKKAKKLINGIDHLSVRERVGIDVCEKLGAPGAFHVLDPTWLLDGDDYRRLVAEDFADCKFSKRTVLGYFVNVHNIVDFPLSTMIGFADRVKADFPVVPLQGTEIVIPDEIVYAPSPAEWLDAYDKCDYVLTNSYHGTIFAILMKKQFLVVRQKKGKVVINDPRFGSMLKLFGLEDRIFQDGSIEQMCLQINQPVKWDDIYNRLQDQRTISRDFLMTALVK